MLEQIDLTKEMGKEEYKEKMEALEGTLSRLQRECRDLGIPVMILFEGFGAAGKGVQINSCYNRWIPGGLRFLLSNRSQKRSGCTRFCGGSGLRRRKKAGSPFLLQAGTGEFPWTGLRRRFHRKSLCMPIRRSIHLRRR